MTDFNRREFMQRTALTGAGLSLFTGELVKTATAYPYPQKTQFPWPCGLWYRVFGPEY